MRQHVIITSNTSITYLIQLKHDLQVDLHQSSSNTCDLHALGFIKSLLQDCLCQQNSFYPIL